MINLKFKIISCYFDNPNTQQKFKTTYLFDAFNEKNKLKTILEKIYTKYSISNKDWFDYNIFNINNLLWRQFFSDDLIQEFNYSETDYINLTIEDLEKQFSIPKILIPIYLDYDGKGKAIGYSEGITFFFHTNEKDLHHKPHIHCKYAGIETRIEIETLKILDKPFKKSKMQYALKIIKENQKELINYWNKVVIKGEKLKFKLDL